VRDLLCECVCLWLCVWVRVCIIQSKYMRAEHTSAQKVRICVGLGVQQRKKKYEVCASEFVY
jgi:hypothetical protein